MVHYKVSWKFKHQVPVKDDCCNPSVGAHHQLEHWKSSEIDDRYYHKKASESGKEGFHHLQLTLVKFKTQVEASNFDFPFVLTQFFVIFGEKY